MEQDQDLDHVDGMDDRIDTNRLKDVRLQYPLSWKPRLNPYAFLVKTAAADFFAEVGVVGDAKTTKILEEERTDLYGGYPYPFANFRHLRTVSEFLALWILFDDLVTEESNDYWEEHGLSYGDYETALRGGPLPSGADPFLRAWWTISQRFTLEMSAAWCDRLADSFVEWLAGTRREREVYAKLRADGGWPDLSTYLDIRSTSVGAMPTFYFIEYVEGFELPTAVMCHPTLAEIHKLATLAIFLANDVMSLEKDRRDDWPNAVTVVQREHAIALTDALARTVEMHNRAVATFVEVEAALPSFGPGVDPFVGFYVERLHYVVRGFTEFERCAERYRWTSHGSAERPFVVPLVSFIED